MFNYLIRLHWIWFHFDWSWIQLKILKNLGLCNSITVIELNYTKIHTNTYIWFTHTDLKVQLLRSLQAFDQGFNLNHIAHWSAAEKLCLAWKIGKIIYFTENLRGLFHKYDINLKSFNDSEMCPESVSGPWLSSDILMYLEVIIVICSPTSQVTGYSQATRIPTKIHQKDFTVSCAHNSQRESYENIENNSNI